MLTSVATQNFTELRWRLFQQNRSTAAVSGSGSQGPDLAQKLTCRFEEVRDQNPTRLVAGSMIILK